MNNDQKREQFTTMISHAKELIEKITPVRDDPLIADLFCVVNYGGLPIKFETSPAGFIRNAGVCPNATKATTFQKREFADRAAKQITDGRGRPSRVEDFKKMLDLAIKGQESLIVFLEEKLADL